MYESLQAQAAFLKLNAQGLYLREVQAAFANLGVRHLALQLVADWARCFAEADNALPCCSCLMLLHLLAIEACLSASGPAAQPQPWSFSWAVPLPLHPLDSLRSAALPCTPWHALACTACHHARDRVSQLHVGCAY